MEDLSKRIAELKALLLGETDSETKKTDAETIGKEVIAQGFIPVLVKNFEKIGADVCTCFILTNEKIASKRSHARV